MNEDKKIDNYGDVMQGSVKFAPEGRSFNMVCKSAEGGKCLVPSFTGTRCAACPERVNSTEWKKTSDV